MAGGDQFIGGPMFRHTNPEKRHGNMWGADFFYGTPYQAFGGGGSGDPRWVESMISMSGKTLGLPVAR
jgi:hypothetical protein